MSNMITPSEEKLYMTEDLEGRLDLANLEKSDPSLKVESEADFYESMPSLTFPPTAEIDLPSSPKVNVAIVFDDGESITLDGNLTTLSFGAEGWLCGLNVEDSNHVIPIALKAAKKPIGSANIALPDGSFSMFTKVDCAVSFSYGSATFTVTSDEARYV